jgi:hypothetical protein
VKLVPRRHLRGSWLADAKVTKAVLRGVSRGVDVTQIDENRLRHERFHTIQVEGAKLAPFRNQYHGVGSRRRIVGIIRIVHPAKQASGRGHPHRIVSPNEGTGILEASNDRQGGRFAHVVGIRLECQSENGDPLAADSAATGRNDLLDRRILATIVDGDRCLDETEGRSVVAGDVGQRPCVLRQA